jgi:hypothetical protein
MTHINQPEVGDIDAVVAKVSQAAFGKPLITNVLRGQVAEAIIAMALEPDWTWCSADYASWDFENAAGCRLEVKQSALRQSWVTDPSIKSVPGFDIAPRKGRWEGSKWIADPRRYAHLYILAYHGVTDDSADHRDPRQWVFFVIPSSTLPPVQRLTLKRARDLAESCSTQDLHSVVNTIAAQCAR